MCATACVLFNGISSDKIVLLWWVAVYSNRGGMRNTGKRKQPTIGGAKRGPAAGRNSKATTGQISPRQIEYVTKRMLSARRLKINELRNEVEAMSQQLEELRRENKTLKRDQFLREKALDKYTSHDNDMAALMSKHNGDMRVAKESLRKYKERNKALEQHLRDTEDELERTKKLLRKMRALADDKELGERDDLARKLSKAEALLDEKDRRVRVGAAKQSLLVVLRVTAAASRLSLLAAFSHAVRNNGSTCYTGK